MQQQKNYPHSFRIEIKYTAKPPREYSLSIYILYTILYSMEYMFTVHNTHYYKVKHMSSSQSYAIYRMYTVCLSTP